MNCLLVPTLALDVSLLDRLADSIDYPIEHQMIINNGRAGALNEWSERHPDWAVRSPGKNIGVAASWNLAPLIWKDDPSWLIVNDDVQFHPGGLELICRRSENAEGEFPILMLNRTNPFYCFVWTQLGVEKFGLFDENFFPGYWEDCDMRVRFRIGGVEHYYITDGCPLSHSKPKVGGINYAAMIQGTGLINRQYFLEKWGSLDENNVRFRTPFNNPAHHPMVWRISDDKRKANEAIWNAFVALGAKLYD